MKETRWLRWKFPKRWFQKFGDVDFWELFDEYALSVYENSLVVITGGDPFTFQAIPQTITFGSNMLIYSPLSGGIITIAAVDSPFAVTAGESLYVETDHPIQNATLPLLAGTQENARWPKTLPMGGRVGASVYIRPNIVVT